MRTIEAEYVECEKVAGKRARKCVKRAVRQLQSPRDAEPWSACNGHSRKAQQSGAKALARYVEPVCF